MSDIRIPAPVVIREPVDSRSWRATLPNGKEIIAFESKVRKVALPPIKPLPTPPPGPIQPFPTPPTE